MKYRYRIGYNLVVLWGMCLALWLCGCARSKQPEVFSEEKPFTVELKRERSYYQAERIVERLAGMDVEAFILQDSTEGGDWYRICSGALPDSAAVEAYVHRLDSLCHLTPLGVMDYASLDSVRRVPVQKRGVEEVNYREAHEPSVQDDVLAVASMFPSTPMFYLESISLLWLSEEGLKQKDKLRTDMPRGISLETLAKKGVTAFGSVIYTDNLYGDQVTLQIAKRTPEEHKVAASLLLAYSEQNRAAVELCEALADLVLATGEYAHEHKEPIEVNSYTLLNGYKAQIETPRGMRNYYILTDERGEYLIFAQSTKEDDRELRKVLEGVGKSKGLVTYAEYYNTFYTLPDKPATGDYFLGYTVSRVGEEYARSRDYSAWSKEMVGRWVAYCYLYNSEKGFWDYAVFDMLTPSTQKRVYGKLYIGTQLEEDIRSVYGVQGAWIRTLFSDELNFGINRYILALSARLFGDYSEDDLMERAELLQLVAAGGYSAAK